MSLAICALLRNETPYLLEWLSFHSLAGATLFRLYDDASDDGSLALLGRLARHFPIEVQRWTLPGANRQIAAFDDALDALRGRADFVAFLDIDEFLFDPSLRPLPVVLAGFPRHVGAIAVNQRVFGSAGQHEAANAPVTRRFTRRAADDYHEHHWFKSIVRPEAAQEFVSSHHVTLSDGQYVLGDGERFACRDDCPSQSDRIAASGPVLNHYMLKSRTEFDAKQARGAVSDQPAERYSRLTEDYFTTRDAHANAMEDRSLLPLAARLEARMQQAAGAVAKAQAAPLVFKLITGAAAAIRDIPGARGLYPVEPSDLAWIRDFEQLRIRFQAPAGATRLSLRCYRITPDYPIDDVVVFVNDETLASRTLAEDYGWFTTETALAPQRPGTNLLAVAVPFFIPTRHLNPATSDRRYLAFVIASIAFCSLLG